MQYGERGTPEFATTSHLLGPTLCVCVTSACPLILAAHASYQVTHRAFFLPFLTVPALLTLFRAKERPRVLELFPFPPAGVG